MRKSLSLFPNESIIKSLILRCFVDIGIFGSKSNMPMESRYIFPTALHLLATAYLDFNHYNNYAAAQTKRFQIRELC